MQVVGLANGVKDAVLVRASAGIEEREGTALGTWCEEGFRERVAKGYCRAYHGCEGLYVVLVLLDAENWDGWLWFRRGRERVKLLQRRHRACQDSGARATSSCVALRSFAHLTCQC